MTPKPIEPMPLDEVRERFRYTATSQISTWEPAEVARMRLTVEALVGALADVIDAWDGRLPMVRADEVVDRARQFVGSSTGEARCLVTDEVPHAGVVGGMYARRCTLRAAHDGPCVFGEP